MKATIIGAGIGGLTTAIALKQRGIEVEIFEATPKFKRAGSGINLALNAMQIFKRLGVYQEIIKAGSYTGSMKITDRNLQPLSTVQMKNFERKFHVRSVAIHRATLHEILLNQLKGTQIHLNKKVKSIDQSESGINMLFEDGSSHSTWTLIGADGIHSAVRKSIFRNTHTRIAKQICWRGIANTDIPKRYHSELNELWGKGKRFGFVHLNDDEIYWYALANYKTNYKEEFKDVQLNEFFSDFHPLVGMLIKSTPQHNILTNEITDLKPLTKWHHKNTCLLGDAAHATTPNMGQGACQAIESAYVISKCLSQEEDVEKAFRIFESKRKKNATKVVNTSWKLGKAAHLNNAIGQGLRNFILKSTPEFITQKQSEQLFRLNY
ncbi:FAD-binding protein [Cytophagales bacterium RKSG123]|nr:FAD-binding protein [Xanthovirga aplysinae]